jgi:hypothetical protein
MSAFDRWSKPVDVTLYLADRRFIRDIHRRALELTRRVASDGGTLMHALHASTHCITRAFSFEGLGRPMMPAPAEAKSDGDLTHSGRGTLKWHIAARPLTVC